MLRWLRRILIDITFVACIPPLLALAAPVWWPFEICAHFHGCYAIGLASWSLILLVAGCRFAALTTGILVVVDAAFVIPLWFGPTPTGPAQIRLLSANVRVDNPEHGRLLELVANEDPDVIAVMEVDGSWMRDLAILADDWPHHKASPRADCFGIAIWSKFPCSRLEIIDVGPIGLPSVHADLELPSGETVRLVVTHTLPPPMTGPPRHRDDQLRAIGDYVLGSPHPVVVAGDLNTSSWGSAFGELCERGQLRDGRSGFGLCPTWPGRLANVGIAIDHVLVDERVDVVDYRVGPNIRSDHRPILADLRVR